MSPSPDSGPSLVSPSGDRVPEHDPRIPTHALIEKQRAAAEELKEVVRRIPGARLQEAELAARLDALISLLLPPEGEARQVFEYRVEENRGANFVRIIEAFQRAKADAEAPRLIVPTVALK